MILLFGFLFWFVVYIWVIDCLSGVFLVIEVWKRDLLNFGVYLFLLVMWISIVVNGCDFKGGDFLFLVMMDNLYNCFIL